MGSLVLLSFVPLWGQDSLPEKPGSWVNDYAGILSPDEVRSLENELSGLEQRSSNQIFIALFDRLPEDSYLEDFAVKLYTKWRPGLADKDNGILIVVFIQDRKIRIEVGYGLEDVITDAQSGMIIRNYIAPEFKKGNYYGGLEAALKVMIPAVEGKYKLPQPEQGKEKKGFSLSTLIIGLIILMILSRIFRGPGSTGFGTRSRGGAFMGPTIFGGFGGGRSGGGFSGGGFGGGFGGMSGGGGASGSLVRYFSTTEQEEKSFWVFMNIKKFLTESEKQRILQAIKEAETETSGEIRLHLETRCKGDALDRAVSVFKKLKMHETHLRNGTLIYLAVADRKFAIFGDEGINEIVPENFWQDVKNDMGMYFKEGKFVDGIVAGIGQVGQKLKEFFPYKDDDINELPDDISTGE